MNLYLRTTGRSDTKCFFFQLILCTYVRVFLHICIVFVFTQKSNAGPTVFHFFHALMAHFFRQDVLLIADWPIGFSSIWISIPFALRLPCWCCFCFFRVRDYAIFFARPSLELPFSDRSIHRSPGSLHSRLLRRVAKGLRTRIRFSQSIY